MRSAAAILTAFILMVGVKPAGAQDAWRARAAVDVPATGFVEIVVPAQLISRTDKGNLNLTLAGPEGGIRAFELYWREPLAEVSLALTPAQVTMDPSKGFVWEAPLPQKMVIRQLAVQLADRSYFGKIKVEGFAQGRWHLLVNDAAVFKTDGTVYGRIDIPKASYERVRLALKGYDQRAQQKLSPIKTVSAVGERMGKDFVDQQLNLPFQQSETQEETLIEAALPGNGLWLQTVSVKTEAQFQGAWQLGRDTINAGQKAFAVFQQGQVSHMDRRRQALIIDTDTAWPGNSLVIKLNTDHRYLGNVTELTVKVRLPRLVFAADRPGRYTLISGGGHNVAVLSHPGDALRQVDLETAVSMIETNPDWRPESLVERFHLKGAPFDPSGYTWRSAMAVERPGYYRLALNLPALLQSSGRAIRIVQDGMQVPYIQGRMQNQTIGLSAEEAYDPKTNQGRWIITLPGPLDQWRYLSLHAEGIFRRTIRWELPKPGNLGWQPWRKDVWENRNLKETAFNLNLQALPAADTERICLIVDNGDNEAIKINKLTATYTTPTFYFLSHQPGELWVYGGNPQASRPQYDLSLVQNELLAELPREVKMGAPDLFQQPDWKNKLGAAFTDSGWGLYAVLGLVTIVLAGVIARLFPKGAGR